jgi:iron complex outermembrane recepter protein
MEVTMSSHTLAPRAPARRPLSSFVRPRPPRRCGVTGPLLACALLVVVWAPAAAPVIRARTAAGLPTRTGAGSVQSEPAPAQSGAPAGQSAAGALRGRVSDEAGAVVVGARVTLRAGAAANMREATAAARETDGVIREALTDERGDFSLGGLRAMSYTLVVEKEGFLPVERALAIGPGTHGLSLVLVLAPAPVNESVTVNEADAALEETLRLPATLRETPRSVAVVGAERAREQNFRQVPDALAYANMTANSLRTGGYHFYSRGYRMGPDDTRVDGFAGVNAGGGFGASLFGVEQVVLLRGPAGLLYGSANAPGGMVNLVTKRPQETRFTRLDLRGGVTPGDGLSNGLDLDTTGAVTGGGRVLYRALFTAENMNYFTRGVLDRNRYAKGSLTFRLDEAGRYTLTPVAQYTRLSRPAGGGVRVSPSTSLSANDGAIGPVNAADLSPNGVNLSSGGRVDETFLAGFDLRAQVTDRLRLSGAHRYVGLEYFVNQFTPQVSTTAQINRLRTEHTVSRVQSKSDSFQRNHSFALDAAYEWRAAGSWRNLTQIGLYRRGLTARTTVPAGGVPAAQSPLNIYTGVAASPPADNFPALVAAAAARSSFLNLYVQNRTSLDGGRWVLTLGLGRGRNTVGGTARRAALIPNAALVFNAARRLLFYASYAESFSPNDASLQDAEGRVDTFAPTKGKNYEAGAKFDLVPRRLSAVVSLFHNEVDTALVQSGAGDFNPNGLRYYVAAGTRRSRGADFSADFRPLSSWAVSGAATYLDAVYTGEAPPSARATAALPGSRAEKSPRWAFNLWNRYERGEGTLKGFGAGLGLVRQAARWGGNGARTPSAPDPLLLPAFTRVDAALFYRLGAHTDFSLNFENLFDELIFVSGGVGSSIEVAAPRNVTFRMGYRF